MSLLTTHANSGNRTISDDRIPAASVRLAAMQPYFFPYLGYFQLFHAANKVILYDNVNFIKSGWIHRNRILEIGKGPRYIGIPLERLSSSKKIRDIRIDSTRDWKTPIMDILRHNYCRMPYYCEVMEVMDAVLDMHETSMSQLAVSSIKAVLEYIGQHSELEYTSPRFDSIEEQLEAFSETFPENIAAAKLKQRRMSDRVAMLCKMEGASTYINPIGGLSLYSKQHFAALGIQLQFLDPHLKPYFQKASEFFPGMSIIDVLMSIGAEGAKSFLEDYSLI